MQQNLGLDIINSKARFRWDRIKVDMSPRGFWTKTKVTKFLHNVKEDLRASTNLKPTFQEKSSKDQKKITF